MIKVSLLRTMAAALIIAAIACTGCKKDDPDGKPSYSVTFDADGGTPAPSAQSVEEGGTVTQPDIPAKDGYIFGGWFAGSMVWDFDKNTVTGDLVLKAGWTPDNAGLAAVAEELAEDAAFSLFAAALSAAGLPVESDGYTVFAVPDKVIMLDTDVMPATDLQWHIIRGRYTAEELLQAKTLQTTGGQTLMAVRETAEIGGEEQTLLYINNIPVDYRSARLMGGNAVYSIGANIAGISNTPDTDDLDAYNSRAARAIEGTWMIERVEKRKYHVWSVSGREGTPFDTERDPTHVGCREIFERNPAKVSQGYAGTYKTDHLCGGSDIGYGNNGYHGAGGWWSVSASRIEFGREVWAGGPLHRTDWFIFEDGIGRTITCTSGYGGDRYYGGDEDEIFDTYYETEYTLRKIHN